MIVSALLSHNDPLFFALPFGYAATGSDPCSIRAFLPVEWSDREYGGREGLLRSVHRFRETR